MGASHILEQETARQVVFGVVLIFPEMTDDIVGAEVDIESKEEDTGSDDEVG